MRLTEKIARHYGIEPQSRQTIEEMAELTQAITKFWRYTGNDAQQLKGLKNAIAEEIGDVEIMLEQLKILFGIEEDVRECRAFKLIRQLERIEKEKVRK